MQHNKQYHRKALLSSFHLNGHTIGFHPQTQKLEPPCKVWLTALQKSSYYLKSHLRIFQNVQTTFFPVVFPARKVPLLIFSGGSNGHVSKWERLQSNNFMYRLPKRIAVSLKIPQHNNYIKNLLKTTFKFIVLIYGFCMKPVGFKLERKQIGSPLTFFYFHSS